MVLGVWWNRTNKQGAVAGMLCGFGVCMFYLIATKYGGMDLWFGVKNISAGLFGVPVVAVVTIVVSLLTPPPPQEMRDMVDAVRIPKGGQILKD